MVSRGKKMYVPTAAAAAAAAAAASLRSCPTLCDPIDDSPPGSAIPGILQARMLEWVAIEFRLQVTYPAILTASSRHIKS